MPDYDCQTAHFLPRSERCLAAERLIRDRPLTLAQTRQAAHVVPDAVRGDSKQLIHNLVPVPNLGKMMARVRNECGRSGSGDPRQQRFISLVINT